MFRDILTESSGYYRCRHCIAFTNRSMHTLTVYLVASKPRLEHGAIFDRQADLDTLCITPMDAIYFHGISTKG